MSQAIAPIYSEMSDRYPDAFFLKIDVDEQPAIAAAAGVTAMPTFQFLKDGEKLREVVGADPRALEAALEDLM